MSASHALSTFLLAAALIVAVPLHPHAAADEIATLDEWWAAYDGYWGQGRADKARQLVAEYKQFAAQAFNEGMQIYRVHKQRGDTAAMRQFYAFLDNLSKQIKEVHGIDSYARDLAEETKGDGDLLGAAKRREGAEVVESKTDLAERYVDRINNGKRDSAKQLIFDNVGYGRLFYFDLLQQYRRAESREERQRMQDVHRFLQPLQDWLQEADPLEDVFQQYEAEEWLLAASVLEEARQAEKRKPLLQRILDKTKASIDLGVKQRGEGELDAAVTTLDGARRTLEFIGMGFDELLRAQRELIETHRARKDRAMAEQSALGLLGTARLLGDEEEMAAAEETLAELAAAAEIPLYDPENWSKWKTVKLKSETKPRRGEDPHGPMREADPRDELWLNLDLTAASIGMVGPPEVRLLKGQNEISLDIDGDGEADEKLDFDDDDPVRFEVTYPDGSEEDYALQFKRHSTFHYLGHEFDHEARTVVFYRRVGWREGRLGATRITITDDNCDGRFDSYGADGMVVGRSEVGTKLSRLVHTGSAILEIDVHPTGREVHYRRYEGDLHVVAARTEVGIARNFIIRSLDMPHGYLELAPTNQGVKIPVGWWRFHEALLVDRSLEERVWVSGKECADVEVTGKGQPEVFSIGSSLSYQWDFAVQPEKDRMIMIGSSFDIVGDEGEIYYGYYPTVPFPLVWFELETDGKPRLLNMRLPQREPRGSNHLDMEQPADVSLNWFPDMTFRTKIQVDHPVLGQFETKYRVEELEVPETDPEKGDPEDDEPKEGE